MWLIVKLNYLISIIFTLCYAYQFFYIIVGILRKSIDLKAKKNNRYAVVVSARNESNVIGNFIESIKHQNYPSELIDIFIVADNCTDNTAEVSREAGAIVYERFNKELVGKGYALDWVFERILSDYQDKNYDAVIIFDADNVVDKDFVAEMNNLYDNGYRIITSYRNSKNYDENWITAGYSLWFLREARYLNNARMQLGISCAISGTGFLVATNVIKENGGWVHHLLTEDIEFTTDSVIKGEVIGYCSKAILYDEQPSTFKQSYTQRLRWAKGFYQVFMKYGKRLFGGVFKGFFSCYDMLMTIMPAMLLTLISIAINIVSVPYGIYTKAPELPTLFKTLGQTILSFYMLFAMLGTITTISEWKQIHCKPMKKIMYIFTFPIFMLTYVPIAIVALFKDVKWEPIKHSVSKTVDDIEKKDK